MNSWSEAKEKLIRTDRVVLHKSFYEFAVAAWDLVASAPLSDAFYIKVVCDHLQAIYEKRIIVDGHPATKIIINIPPRTGKSLIVNVLFPVWIWLHNPREAILTASYAHSLSEELAQIRRDQLLKSPWFRDRWPDIKLVRTQEQKVNYANTVGGRMQAVSVGGATTGKGGGIRILDDPHNPQQALSDAERASSIRWLRGTWATRRNQPDALQIVVMQRLHEVDATGFYIKIGGWVHLKIAMEYDPSIAVDTPIWSDSRQKGESIDPVRFPAHILAEDKRTMSNYDVAGQYQQEPAPAEGGHIKRWYLQPYEWREEGGKEYIHVEDDTGQVLVHFDPWAHFRFATVDVAKTEKEIGANKQDDPDFTVMACWAIFRAKEGAYLFLLDLVRGQMEGPDFLPLMQGMYDHWKPAVIGVETVGLEMISQFAKRKGLPIGKIRRGEADKKKTNTEKRKDDSWLRTEKDKMSRVVRATVMMQQRRFFRPAYAPWYLEYERELCFYPNMGHDDQVDVTTDACLVAEVKDFTTFLERTKALDGARRRGKVSAEDRKDPNPDGFQGRSVTMAQKYRHLPPRWSR